MLPFLDSPDSHSHVLGCSQNELTTEGTGTHRHCGPRPLRMSVLTCGCSIAVIACAIGLFHMARANRRPTSDKHNETILVVRFCSVCTASPVLEMRICVYTPRRLQWIVIDCKQKMLSVHIVQVPPHIKIGCTPVRLT